MAGLGAGFRALAAAASRHLVHQSATFRRPLLADDYLRSIAVIPSMGYVTKAKKRERASRRSQSDDEALSWYHNDDRHLPWPNRRQTREEKDQEREKKKNYRRSFKLRCEKYLKPFTLDIYISNKYVHASIMHRALHKVVAVANSNAKEFRGTLPAYGDTRACWVIGKVLSDRAKEADVYTVVYEPRRGEKLDTKIMTIVDTLVENGIALELDKN
ncbi:unnamed protein product [Calypogeia fissa]